MSAYPYTSALNSIDQIIQHLRKTPLKNLDSSVLKKLSIAPGNETFIINMMRALGVFDNDGKAVDSAMEVFLLSDDEFGPKFAKLIEVTYSALFELHGDAAWSQEKSKLVSFFRQADKTSDLIGGRQAEMFMRLAAIAGKRELPKVAPRAQTTRVASPRKANGSAKTTPPTVVEVPTKSSNEEGLTLSVKVEVNLPPTSDQAVYDAIFKSIRQQLIDRE